jgi:hypothetical protein
MDKILSINIFEIILFKSSFLLPSSPSGGEGEGGPTGLAYKP